VLVPVAQDIRVDVKLEVGKVDQSVTVNGNDINIDTTTATLGETIDNARLEDLPLNGRNAADLLGLLPGVADVSAPVYQTSARGGPSFSISGSRTDFGDMQLDGQTITDAIELAPRIFPLPTHWGNSGFLPTATARSMEGRAAGSSWL
jgi:hypothetical protein